MSDNNTNNFSAIIELYDDTKSRSIGVLNKVEADNLKKLTDHTIMNCTYDGAVEIIQTKISTMTETELRTAITNAIANNSYIADVMWIAANNGSIITSSHVYENYYINDLIITTTVDGSSYTSKRLYNLTNNNVMTAVLIANGTDNYTLKFYYDDIDHALEGTSFQVDNTTDWRNNTNYNNVTSIIFDPTFIDAKPRSCANWFKCEEGKSHKARYIIGLDNLNTSQCETFEDMFSGSKFIELDVRNFNTSAASNFNRMFAGCEGLRNIFSNNASHWTGLDGATSTSMFLSCLSLPNFRSDEVTIEKAFAGAGGYFTASLTNGGNSNE